MLLLIKNIFVCIVIVSIVGIDNAWAWGPATHLHYGYEILSQLHLLPTAMAELLNRYPKVYLYGTISADIVLAKKFGKDFQHCHHWHNGFSLLDYANSEREQAFVWGYLSHLAADCISHNCFVPSHMVLSYDKKFLNHMYWELRFDQMLTNEKILDLFKELSEGDFEDCDALFEKHIQVRVMDFSFNKKVFQKILVLQGVKQWQNMLQKMQNSDRWQLSPETVQDYCDRSLNAVQDLLNFKQNAAILEHDPRGVDKHKLAGQYRKQMRLAFNVQEHDVYAKVKELEQL
ncbi:MAG TPA: zinc dependent phospholipase C family protein [Oligoflexia bacterium]|nr:zinc dependent phospholipase C family protein [Oligoflexia bacterium]